MTTTMQWRKHGVVWTPSGERPWARSHATCPTPITLPDGRIRVYLQSRDAGNVGRVGYVDLDPEDPRRVVNEAQRPVLDVGTPGSFDDNGVFQTSVLRWPDGRLAMYYVGFELCHHIRYRLLTGLALSEDGGETFVRVQPTPILERSPREQHIRGGPWVVHDGGRFRMWYVAGSEWEMIEGKPMPIYDIRHITSDDGVHWPDEGQVVLPVTRANEHGFGRPVATRTADGWQMHYSVRRRDPARYRLGYATSPDGLHWTRLDETIGLDVSTDGFDADAIEYGVEIEAAGRTWLLYNGNDFGVTGFGIAELLAR